MPLARFMMYAGGEDVHVSLWPGNPSVSQLATSFIGFEGRTLSVNCSGLLTMKDVPTDFEFYDDLADTNLSRIFSGGSKVVSPSGECIWQAEIDKELLFAFDVDLEMVRAARQSFDASGHYFRPDLFKISVDRSRGTESIQGL